MVCIFHFAFVLENTLQKAFNVIKNVKLYNILDLIEYFMRSTYQNRLPKTSMC